MSDITQKVNNELKQNNYNIKQGDKLSSIDQKVEFLHFCHPKELRPRNYFLTISSSYTAIRGIRQQNWNNVSIQRYSEMLLSNLLIFETVVNE